MGDKQIMFYDDCFVTKYKRLRGLVPQISCDGIPVSNSSKRSVTNNVDYFSFKLTESQLYECWKIIHHKAAMKDVKMLNKQTGDENMYNRVEDLMLLIPSTSSKRLENSAWRAWAKERFQLAELNPLKLNWFKENDITWLYGPLIMNEEEEEKQQNFVDRQPKLERVSSSESLSSLTSSGTTESSSSLDTCSISSENLSTFHSKPMIKPILSQGKPTLRRESFDGSKLSFMDSSNCKRKKRVSFNSIMEKREIIGDEVYDYNLQFIDNEKIAY